METLTAILEEDAAGAADGARGRCRAVERDRAAVPGEGAGGALPLGARPGVGARGGAGPAPRAAALLGGGGDDEPVPGAWARSRRRTRTASSGGRRGRGALAAPPGAAAPRGDRALGGGQDVVRARGCRGVAAGGLGGGVCDAGGGALPGLGQALAPELAGTSRRCGGSCGSRTPAGRSRPRERWRKAPRRGAPRRGPVRGAVHAEPAGGAGALRGAPGPARARGRTCTCCCRCATTS